MSYEIYGEGVDEFVVGLYCLKDFPEINLYINVDESKIIEVFLEDEWFNKNFLLSWK